jgi:hypothetical protein
MTFADLLPRLPLSPQEGQTYGLVFSAALAQRLKDIQAEHPQQFVVVPMPMIDGRFYVWGGILSEVPNGLYAVPFSFLDSSKFDQIEVMPIADAVALLPPQQPDEG